MLTDLEMVLLVTCIIEMGFVVFALARAYFWRSHSDNLITRIIRLERDLSMTYDKLRNKQKPEIKVNLLPPKE